MSAETAAHQNVQTMADYLRETYVGLTKMDGQVHDALDYFRHRLLALEMAEDPDVLADLALIKSGKVDGSDAFPAAELVERVRARHSAPV